MKKKKRLLFLIESQIRASQLMNLLTQDIDLDVYLADYSTLIFELMGIDTSNCTDELYSTYFALINKGEHIDLKNDHTALKQLSLQIYSYLSKYSELCAILKEG